MKNLKTIALGLMVGAMAIGFSSFTNTPVKKSAKHYAKLGFIADSYIVQVNSSNVDGAFQELDAVDPLNCSGSATFKCIYDVTTLGASNIPDEPETGYTQSQISTYVTNGWLSPESTNGVYAL